MIVNGDPRAEVLRDAISGNLNKGYIPTFAEVGRESYSATGGVIGINDYGVKGRRQFIAERRRLLDLYVIVMNTADVRTAVTHLRNEIFRRGIDWAPAFEFKCDICGKEYTTEMANETNYECSCRGKDQPVKLRKPDQRQVAQFQKFMDEANYFQQSLEKVLRTCEDDINIVDDAFVYMRKRYFIKDTDFLKYNAMMDSGYDYDIEPDWEVLNILRLDPTLIEFDMDARGIPGMAHHLCVMHRDTLLAVPTDQSWDVRWEGRCPVCNLRTFPVYYKYSEQQSGAYGAAAPQTLYLLKDEVIHWSRYSPSETYGYPPVLSVYEKALTLIGMDRYLYDYFYERRVPQGVVTVVTDDVDQFERSKREVETKMQYDPHYIPWVAVSSNTGQGGINFVRFAYSLDELDYLPVRDEIRERISGQYGVSNIWMNDTGGDSGGGLNNESQQLVVMSRVVEGAQRSYHTEVFPKIEKALRVTDWHLYVRTPEEASELRAIELSTAKATHAQTMGAMGFGIDYDQQTDTFSFSGRVKSMEEQQEAQQEMAQQNPFGGGSEGGSKMPENPIKPPKNNGEHDYKPGANVGTNN